MTSTTGQKSVRRCSVNIFKAVTFRDRWADVHETCLIRRTITCRRRPSDPWFDDECRRAKRSVRRLKRASSRASQAATAAPSPVTIADAAAAAASWTTERCAYRDLRRQKRESMSMKLALNIPWVWGHNF